MSIMSEARKTSNGSHVSQNQSSQREDDELMDADKCNETSLIDHIDDLYAYALSLTRDRNESDDLVQDTCIRALKSFSSLTSQNKLKPWLMAILRNVWISQLRKRRTTPTMVEIDNQLDIIESEKRTSTNPCEHLLSKTEAELVQRALQRLPPVFREIIVLREYQELSYEEMAVTLRCPIGTVMSRLARARSKLRTLLSSYRKRPHADIKTNK